MACSAFICLGIEAAVSILCARFSEWTTYGHLTLAVYAAKGFISGAAVSVRYARGVFGTTTAGLVPGSVARAETLELEQALFARLAERIEDPAHEEAGTAVHGEADLPDSRG